MSIRGHLGTEASTHSLQAFGWNMLSPVSQRRPTQLYSVRVVLTIRTPKPLSSPTSSSPHPPHSPYLDL
jgi:hypothetical protein